LNPPLRFASLYVALGTARNTGHQRDPESLLTSQDHNSPSDDLPFTC
jgi:hypothetical protein